MEEDEFRSMLELFPVVRSRDYCDESGSSGRSATKQARALGTAGSSRNETGGPEDQFLQKLRMAAEKKLGATKAELFCKAFKDAHETLVHKELNLDAAQRFANADEN